MADELAHVFIGWLDLIPNRHWLVVGDGGELVKAILEMVQPSAVTVAHEVEPANLPADVRVRFRTATAKALPFESGAFDVAVSASTDAQATIAEMRRVLWPAGVVALLIADDPGNVEGSFDGADTLAAPPGATRLQVEGQFRQAGLHAIQSVALGDVAYAVRGTR